MVVVDLVEQDIDLALRNGPLADSALKARLMLRGRAAWCAPRHPIGQTMLHPITQMTWPRTIASSTRALDRTFSSWSFTVEGRPVTVRVAGNRVANDGGVLRQWALDGHGVIMRKRLGYPQGACLWRTCHRSRHVS